MARRKKNRLEEAPDPGLRGRFYQGVALSMLFSAFFGGLVLMDGWFSRRLVYHLDQTVLVATTAIVSIFWPSFIIQYFCRIRKSARRRRFERQSQLVEEKRVERVHQLLHRSSSVPSTPSGPYDQSKRGSVGE